MRVVRVHEPGPPAVLKAEEADAPRPGPRQVVVSVERATVIYGDVLLRAGRYPHPMPYVPGFEIGGRVVAAGPEADPALVGQRVVATTPGQSGGYAESALADVTALHPVPDGLAVDRALAVFQAGALAVGILSAIRFRPGDTVLVTAAAGRIGSMLVQLAGAGGAAQVIGAAGGPEKLAAAREFGADAAVDYRHDGWVDEVKDLTAGRGADVVLDAVGGTIGTQALAATADGSGRFGPYGFTSGSWTPLDTFEVGRRGLTVTGVLGITFAKPAAELRADTEEALKAVGEGRLVPRVHAAYPLAEAARAHADLEERRTIGAVLLHP